MQNDSSEYVNPTEARELLAYYNELGCNETLEEKPIDRFNQVITATPKTNIQKINTKIKKSELIPEESAFHVANTLAKKALNLSQLKSSLATFEFCDLKRGARNLVFGHGNTSANVMIVGDAPNPQEDRMGKPFVGDEGILLDKMFSAIGLSRNSEGSDGIYVSTIIPWKPLHTQSSIRAEVDMLFPFIKKHIQLINPKFLIFMGADPSTELFHRIGGNDLSEKWGHFLGIETVKIHHPKYLIKNSAAKKEAWEKLQELKVRLNEI